MKQRLASFCSSGWGLTELGCWCGRLLRLACGAAGRHAVWGCRGNWDFGGVVGRERGGVAGRDEMGGRSSHRRVNVRDMPTFTKEEIVHLGDLARIALTDEEITRLQGDLNVIAESINKVQEVATDDVEPTANPIPLEAYLRPDVPETPLTQEEATAGAPVSEAGMFVAPRILGEE